MSKGESRPFRSPVVILMCYEYSMKCRCIHLNRADSAYESLLFGSVIMRVVLQRCLEASVAVNGDVVGAIGSGLVLLLGIGPEDSTKDVEWMCNKVIGLRIFEDSDGKMNRSVMDIEGEILVVSQFTLYGNCRKGRRPSFAGAGHQVWQPLVDEFCQVPGQKSVSKVGG